MFLTETFRGWSQERRPKQIQLRVQTQSIPGKQRDAQRTHARFAFVSRAGKMTRILARDAENFQLLVVQIDELRIAGHYTRPGATQKESDEVGVLIKSVRRGPFVVIGDFNTRLKRWCTQNSHSGTAHIKWLQRKTTRRQFHAPPPPTYMQARTPSPGQEAGAGCSTIVIVLSSGAYVHPLTVHGRLVAGSTDHCPVLAIIDLPRQAAPKGTMFMASRYRLKTALSVDARNRYCEEIPALQGGFEAATNVDQFNNAYADLLELIRCPWRQQDRPRPSRYKTFWTKAME
jgi:endonuclease/exonuclease/phosphatase family metal-dependent hydrolase